MDAKEIARGLSEGDRIVVEFLSERKSALVPHGASWERLERMNCVQPLFWQPKRSALTELGRQVASALKDMDP